MNAIDAPAPLETDFDQFSRQLNQWTGYTYVAIRQILETYRVFQEKNEVKVLVFVKKLLRY
jgi:hypothetical protein